MELPAKQNTMKGVGKMKEKTFTFKGGIHPPYSKELTRSISLTKATDPAMVYIPLQQHIGAPAELLVKKGEQVKVGQKIGEAKGFVSVPVHSSVSGIVKEIGTYPTPIGTKVKTIIIENDTKNEIHENVQPKGKIENLSSNKIIEIIKEAGITGMGGASFPTHVKLSPPEDKKIDTVILNGAECEPYLTSDHRLMVEYSEKVIYGLKAIMKAIGVSKGIIGIENNKPDAIEAIRTMLLDEPGIQIAVLETKYPQGGEKRLIDAITGRKVSPGSLPMDVGVVVDNVGTAAAIADAIQSGMPLIERIVTVTGSGIKKPQNLVVKIGTLFKDIIEQCDGYLGDIGKIISGGPMMGFALYTDEVPVIKGTSGILVLDQKDTCHEEEQPCLKCARCVDVCPVGLLPIKIANYSSLSMWEEAKEYHALFCIECGSCSFICPSKRPLVQRIRLAKGEILAQQRANKGGLKK